MTGQDELEARILDEALSAPSLAIMRLSVEIDREIRRLLASLGRLSEYRGQSLPSTLNIVGRSTPVPSELRRAVDEFWSVRNQVVHGVAASENYVARALDFGFRVLRILKTIPRHRYFVERVGIPLYADSQCSRRRDVDGVNIRTAAPDGSTAIVQVFPSSKQYRVGEEVSWEWNFDRERQWGETWYRDDPDDPPKLAWSGSMEFYGRPMGEV